MSKSPGLFIDIGKKARDLLYKDYVQKPPNHFEYESFDWCFDFDCQVEDVVPGLHTVFKSFVPNSGKVELQYLHDYIGLTSGIGLKSIRSNSISNDPKLKGSQSLSDPMYGATVNFSGVIGSNLFSLGTEVAFDISGTLDKYNAGLSFNTPYLIASLTLSDLQTLKTSYYQAVNPLTRTAIAAELKHAFVNNGTTTFTVGGQHALCPSTLVKARMDSDGKVGALIQQDFFKKLYFTIAGEADFRDLNRVPKVGFSMALG